MEKGKNAPEFLPLSTIFYYLMLDFYVKTGIRFSLRDKLLFEITEVEITRVDCIMSVNTAFLKLSIKMPRLEMELLFVHVYHKLFVHLYYNHYKILVFL